MQIGKKINKKAGKTVKITDRNREITGNHLKIAYEVQRELKQRQTRHAKRPARFFPGRAHVESVPIGYMSHISQSMILMLAREPNSIARMNARLGTLASVWQ